jgi:hypothetical protein
MGERDNHTNRLFHNGEIVAEITKVGNHSLSNRDVYDAFVFGKPFRMFEYINPAKEAVEEKVKARLSALRGVS